ncbi:hypothetical protein QFZ62_001476 [Clavibacter sp. B3I6]|uniref:hypothetical protein n=1 Tax=Clavibacter sp. B3I6 TaxID=3042268 RepID=UPI002783A733|nr:hypothetical protein [Clavibacter sp. B3I6]MDQ0744168.1 hypothetical protein [Clavibacter sp. B3I6]
MTSAAGIVFVDIVDIDGTLVPAGSRSSYLAAHLGDRSEPDAAEDRSADAPPSETVDPTSRSSRP